jgi:hypothetical protein
MHGRRILVLAMALAIGWIAPRATSQHLELEGDDAALALAVAKVCANESSLFSGSPADCALIWQTVRRRGGETSATRLTWLSEHSSCVLTDREMVGDEALGNCRWTRGLTATAEEPSGWPDHWSWERASERWDAMRRLCTSFVARRRPRGGWPCEEDPDTWGGRMDRARAERIGLVPIECEGTINDGYRFPPRRPLTITLD